MCLVYFQKENFALGVKYIILLRKDDKKVCLVAKQLCRTSITSKMAQDKNVELILPTLISKGIFTDSVSAVDIFDLDHFEQRILDLKNAFHEDFITHLLDLKANPIRGILQSILMKLV